MDEARRLTQTARDEVHGLRYFVPDMTVAPTPVPTAPHINTALGVNRWVVSPDGLPSLWGNRAMVMVSSTPQVGDLPVSLNFYQNMGALGAGAGANLLPGLRGGLDMFGGQQFLGGAGTLILGEANDRIGLGMAMIGMGDHRLELLGPGTAADPPDSVWVRWSQHRGPGVAFDPQRFVLPFGLGGKAVITHNDRVEYSACISRAELLELVQQHPLRASGLRALPNRLAIAVGLRPAALTVPSLDDPLGLSGRAPALGLGEVLMHRTTGNWSWAISPALLAARLVGCRNAIHEREVSVRRVGEHHVRLVSAPRHTVAWSGSADVLLLAEIYRTRTRAHAERQEFALDLRQAPAQALYQRLIQGQVIQPTEGPTAGAISIRHEEATVQGLRGGVGMPRWPLIPAATRIAGWGDHRSPFRETHVLRTAAGTRTSITSGLEQEQHRGLGGVQKMRIEATAHDQAQHMAFRAHLSCDKLGPTAHTWLQETLGNALLEPHAVAHSSVNRRHSYDLLLEAAVDYTDLAQTPPARVEAVAARSGIDAALLRTLLHAVQANTTAAQRTDLLHTFVQAQGLRGMAALCLFNGHTPTPWAVSIQSSAWEQPLQRMGELLTLQGWGDALLAKPSAGSRSADLAERVRQAAAQTRLDAASLRHFAEAHGSLQRAYHIAQNEPGLRQLAPVQHAALLARLRMHMEICAAAAITAPSCPPPHFAG